MKQILTSVFIALLIFAACAEINPDPEYGASTCMLQTPCEFDDEASFVAVQIDDTAYACFSLDFCAAIDEEEITPELMSGFGSTDPIYLKADVMRVINQKVEDYVDLTGECYYNGLAATLYAMNIGTFEAIIQGDTTKFDVDLSYTFWEEELYPEGVLSIANPIVTTGDLVRVVNQEVEDYWDTNGGAYKDAFVGGIANIAP